MNPLDAEILKDSSSYQLLEEMIRVDEARSLLLAMATDRFGPPSGPQKHLVDGIDDHDRLVGLCKKVWGLSTWDELLASEPAD